MIKQDKRNYRKHSDKNKALINKSLSELGAGRSILIDADNEIIAGNGVHSQWGNKPIRVIETDGSELIAIKRTDLHTEDDKRKRLAIMDNSSSDSSEFDMELLQCDFEGFELEDMGVDIPTFESVQDYSDKNKEIDVDDYQDEMILKLKYNEDEYNQVREALSKIAATPEQAVFILLKL